MIRQCKQEHRRDITKQAGIVEQSQQVLIDKFSKSYYNQTTETTDKPKGGYSMLFTIINTKTRTKKVVEAHKENKDGMYIQVIRTNHRPFYDSEWKINVEVRDGRKVINECFARIVRDDTETPEALEERIRAFGKNITAEDIQSLDEKAKIFYD